MSNDPCTVALRPLTTLEVEVPPPPCSDEVSTGPAASVLPFEPPPGRGVRLAVGAAAALFGVLTLTLLVDDGGGGGEVESGDVAGVSSVDTVAASEEPTAAIVAENLVGSRAIELYPTRFAGVYLDAEGEAVVRLVDPLPSDLLELRAATNAEVRVEPSTFALDDWQAHQARLSSVLESLGASYTVGYDATVDAIIVRIDLTTLATEQRDRLEAEMASVPSQLVDTPISGGYL
jgi:hypothetical protein